MLSADQRRTFDTVQSHLIHQKRHETSVSVTTSSNQASVWKDLAVQGCSSDCSCTHRFSRFRCWWSDYPHTLSLFQLPIEHEGKSAEYWSLPKASQVMKTKLRGVKLIIGDEISMVSSLTLTYTHLRLEGLFGGDDWFGARNMMFVGDLQLQPVNSNPVFQNITQKTILHKLKCTASVDIWRDSVVYDELTSECKIHNYILRSQIRNSRLSNFWPHTCSSTPRYAKG